MARKPLSASILGDTTVTAAIDGTKVIYRKGLSLSADGDGLVRAFGSKLYAKKPLGLLAIGDERVRATGEIFRRIPMELSVELDRGVHASLDSLRPKYLGVPPKLSVFHHGVNGLKPLDGATLRRGDFQSLRAFVIGGDARRFVHLAFVAKLQSSDLNSAAVVFADSKSGSVSVADISQVATGIGIAEQLTIEIEIPPKRTAALDRRTTLIWEFQVEDPPNEIYSTCGHLTIVPDVYHYSKQ